MHTIVLATDGSPSAQNATEKAVELARATGWPLRIVSAWQPPNLVGSYYGYAIPAEYAPELIDAERQHAERVVAEAAERAEATGVSAQTEIRQGSPVEEISAAATDADASFIVVGAHGWGGLKRFVFGSVSTGLLHDAPCGVLVVRGGETAVEPALAVAAEDQAS